MVAIHLSEIWQCAHDFRVALERCPRDRLPDMPPFPRGWCADASALLGQFMTDQKIAGWQLVTGSHRLRRDEHAWISRGTLLVDITADQFGDGQPPVIVSTRSQWHEEFDIDLGLAGQHALIDLWYDAPTRGHLLSLYIVVGEYLPRR
jgi:hypothetical protein